MEKLVNPRKTIETVKKYEFVFRKKFGQNFLIDEHVVQKIIAAAKITKEDTILEVGPGIGTLTQYLAEAAGRVISVEIDRNLRPILSETLSGYENVTVIYEDILKVDLAELVRKENGGRPVKVAANLPYYITTPILMGLLERHVPIESITVMVQKEVAGRMMAAPGTKEYGALTLAIQYYGEPYLAANVPPNCFLPRPKVGSAVLHLSCYTRPPVAVCDEKRMFQIIRASFNQRRKTLANGLKNAQDLSYSREEVVCALQAMNLSEAVRGETLTLAQFARLTDLLEEGSEKKES